MRGATVMLVIAASSTPAFASERDDERKAKAHVAQGMDHFRAGRYEQAVMEFRTAKEFVNSSALTWNMARAYEELGDIRNAVHYYEELLSEFPDDESADEAELRLADLRPKAPGGLVVECKETPGARVIVDDDKRGAKDCAAKFPSLDPGVHAVRVVAPGKPDWVDNVRVAAGHKTIVHVDWSKAKRRSKRGKRKRKPRMSEGPGLPWTAVGLTAAAVGLATGALVFHLRSEAAVDDYEALHDRDSVTADEVHAQADAANSDATVAASLLGAALLTGAGAAWVWTW